MNIVGGSWKWLLCSGDPYTQLTVSTVWSVYHCGTIWPKARANRIIIWTLLIDVHWTMLHAKYRIEEDFSRFCIIKFQTSGRSQFDPRDHSSYKLDKGPLDNSKFKISYLCAQRELQRLPRWSRAIHGRLRATYTI